jgi:hypothetical protein
MSTIRRDLIYATINRAVMSIDYNIHNNIHKQQEFIEQKILTDSSLTNDEKTEAIRIHRSKLAHVLQISSCETSFTQPISSRFIANFK